MGRKLLVLLGAPILVVACSQNSTEQSEPAPTDVERGFDLDGYVVQKDGVDAEEAKKATVKELDRLVKQLSDAKDLTKAFKLAEAIEDLGKGIAPDLKKRLNDIPERPRIAALKAIWALDEWDTGVFGLLAIVEGEGAQDDRVAAAEVLSSLASTRHEERLKESLTKKVFSPNVRVALAVALWNSSKNTAATKILREMLESENDSFRISAALALGEINQTTKEAREILEQLAEEPTLRGKTAARALEYARAIKRLDAVLQGNHPSMPKREKIDTRLLDTLYDMIQERYIYPKSIDGRKLYYAAANGMLSELDPYTCMLEDNQLRDAANIRQFEVPSLGFTLGSARFQERGHIRVFEIMSVYPNGPASRAGLRPGDQIFRVLKNVTRNKVYELRLDDADVPFKDKTFQSLPIDEALSLLTGPEGSTLGVRVAREGWLVSRWIYLKHEVPQPPKVSHETLPGGIGMVHINALNATTVARVDEALKAFKEAESKAVILDLRNCSNGSVEAATNIAGRFLAKGTLVTESQGRSEELAPRKEFKTAFESPDTTTPVVVIVNKGTADAAEVLAGALGQHDRAKLVGETTFGRSIVTDVIPFNADELKKDGRKAALLLTVARYYGPVSKMPYFDRGVSVDTELKELAFEGWVYDELDVVRNGDAFAEYMKSVMALDEAVKRKLAKGDDRKIENWPNFNDFFGSLDVHLSKENVRWLVRRELRRQMLANGADINKVDLQEDEVFTGALKEAAKLANIDLSDIPEYSTIKK